MKRPSLPLASLIIFRIGYGVVAARFIKPCHAKSNCTTFDGGPGYAPIGQSERIVQPA